MAQDKGRQAAVNGFAHQHIVNGILMKKYQNVSLVNLPLSPYDIIIVFKQADGKEDIIRAQVKTARDHISFIGGSRGGVDRITVRDSGKIYTQTTKTSDIVVGLHPRDSDSFDLYFVPTVLVEVLRQTSIALSKIEKLKNNYEVLEKCKDKDFILSKCREYGIIR